MRTSKKVKVHSWVLLDSLVLDGVDYFQYRCKKCNVHTLNGVPLLVPFNEKCGVDKS
jgi:hypothetical protein